jgi:hypothetical protein
MTNLVTGVIFIGLLVLLVSLLGQNGAALAVIVFVLLSNLVLYRSLVRCTGVRLMPFVRAPAGA